MKILQPAGWPRPSGYSNGISAQGRMIFTAGVIGSNEQGMVVDYAFERQFGLAMRNILAILAEDGAGPEHIVRLTIYIPTGPYCRARRVAPGGRDHGFALPGNAWSRSRAGDHAAWSKSRRRRGAGVDTTASVVPIAAGGAPAEFFCSIIRALTPHRIERRRSDDLAIVNTHGADLCVIDALSGRIARLLFA